MISIIWQKVWPFLFAILFFALIIIIHELGHFTFAKIFKVKVNEFSIGMGPKLFSKIKGDTKYSLRLLPIGGYVQMEGEDEESDDENSFEKKDVWKRIIIVAAGAVMNLILGFILVSCMLGSQELIGTTEIYGFFDSSVSSQYLQAGDKIESINGMHCYSSYDVQVGLMRDDDGIVDFTVKRDGEYVKLDNVAFKTQKSDDAYGKNDLIIVFDFQLIGKEPGFFNSIKYGALQSVSLARLVFISIYDLCAGQFGFSELSGPIGTVKIVADTASNYNISDVLFVMAFISINIGVFNLLPFPVLDGGKLFILIIEGAFKKKLKKKTEMIINTVSFIILFAFIAVVSVSDIINLF